MKFQIGNKNPTLMMVGNRHVKKASMFERKSSTTYNIDHSKMSYKLIDQAMMEYLDNSAVPGTIDVSFVRSSFNKSNRTLTFSSITVRYLANYHGFPGGTILTMMLGLTYPIRTNNIYDPFGQLPLTMVSANKLSPDVTEYRAKATDVTIQFSYSEWNQIYTETTNSWWEERIVYERVKNVYPNLIPYSTNPANKNFTITYGSTTVGSRRLNNVTMTHESDYFGGISINIAGSLYPTTRTLLSTEADTSKIPYSVLSGLAGDSVTINAYGIDAYDLTIDSVTFGFSRNYAFDGAHIEISSGNKSGGEFYTPMGDNGWYTRVTLNDVAFTPEEWNQFVITYYRYRMTASSLTFSQIDWDKFYV